MKGAIWSAGRIPMQISPPADHTDRSRPAGGLADPGDGGAPVLRFVTTADTQILAAAGAVAE